MAQTLGQGLKSRQQPPSPASSGRGDDVSKFSLLGQQFSRYGPVQHRDPTSKAALVGLSPVSRAAPSQIPPISQCQRPLGVPGHDGNNGGNIGTDGQGRSFSNPQHQQTPSVQGYGSLYAGQGLSQSNFGENNYSTRNSPKACNPQVLLNTLSLLQQKIHQLRSLVELIAREGGQSPPNVAQQQEVTTRVASIISQLVVAAAGMFPSSQQQGVNLPAGPIDLQLGHHFGVVPGLGLNAFQLNEIGSSTIGMPSGPVGENNIFGLEGGLGGPNIGGLAASSHSVPPQVSLRSPNPASALDPSLHGDPSNGKMLGEDADASNCHHGNGSANPAGNSFFGSRGSRGVVSLDDHDFCGGARDDDDDGEGENLPPGSYELIEMDAVEILAEHTHFCEICGKGFKRDANLRMHMRGHGDEYKTPAALARPDKAQDLAPIQPRRYSCPFLGCKRNKKHKKFQPLKTILCVKNHYRRSHCPKMFTCNRCKNKKFSVVADLKTHEKHCGRDKWQCSCGTTFSRKDKLFGHITLFQGHTPALPPNESEGPAVTDQRTNNGVPNSIGNTVLSFASGCGNGSGLLAGSANVSTSYGNGNVSSVGLGSNGSQLDACHGAVHSGGGFKNINFSEEDNGHAMGGHSSNTMSGFHQAASALMSGPFTFHSLLCNDFLQQNGEDQNSNVLQ